MAALYVIMGVSGSGKTTIGQLLAKKLDVPFFDADDFHPNANKDKMAAGIPLTDKDRKPWLKTLAFAMKEWQKSGGILACSALKEDYRNQLISKVSGEAVTWVFLHGTQELIASRLAKRNDHFFDPDLLQSQFDSLEIPRHAIQISIAQEPEAIIKQLTERPRDKSSLGLMGLGVMGKSLARNFAREGISLSLYNRNVPKIEEGVAHNFIDQYKLINTQGFEEINHFIQSLERPRKVFLMVPADAVDALIDSLTPLLEAGDIIMDGGNSHFKATEARIKKLATYGINYLGIGVSGGERGALYGPSIMPGGSQEAYKQVATYLKQIAAKSGNDVPCCSYVGKGGSGHFVKMIHNGIEYGEMQLLAEVYYIMRFGLEMTAAQIADVFESWNEGELTSYLLETTIIILRKHEHGVLVLDTILDKAAQKGTGTWSAIAALELGQSFDIVLASVLARNISGEKRMRTMAYKCYNLPVGVDATIALESLEKAYTIARIINHAIGFETINKASKAYAWDIRLSDIARLWTKGCILKSQLINTLIAYLEDTPNLLLHKELIKVIESNYTALGESVTYGVSKRLATPGLSAALQYIIASTTKDSSANLIQAQRDFFGAHTYERIDTEGKFHTLWIS